MLDNLFERAMYYNVDPVIFILIYLLSIPFFYYPLLKVKELIRLRERNINITGKILFGILINGAAWSAPYLYVILVGRNIPSWIFIIMMGYLFLGLVYLVFKINKGRKIEN